MRIGNKTKKLISLLAVLIILVTCCVTPAHASLLSYSQRQRLGAMISSALLAMNITLSSTVAPYQQVIDYVPDALGLPTATWDDDYMDRSTIQIWKDYVEIDGVPYTDVWLSTEAAEKFRTEGFDFKTAYNLVNNSNGTFASGAGYIDGCPAFATGGTPAYRTQNYQVTSPGTYGMGDTTVTVTESGTNWILNMTNSVNQNRNVYYSQSAYPVNCYYGTPSLTGYGATAYTQNKVGTTGNTNLTQTPKTVQPFDFDWVSGTIPADEQLPDGTGMMIRVPSDTFDDFYNEHPDFVINAPIDIDFNLDPDLKVEIDDLIDAIIPVLVNLDVGDINFIENHTQPAPVQDTLLPDTWWSQVSQKLDQVIQTIQNISFQDVIQAIQTIPSAITQAVSNITQAISNLGDQIIQDIEQGPIKVFDKALDKLRDIFLPILLSLKSALGIWHYVVEWMGNISGTLTWYVSAFSGISSTLMSPIYAVIAGWIVIMVYRRFGR